MKDLRDTGKAIVFTDEPALAPLRKKKGTRRGVATRPKKAPNKIVTPAMISAKRLAEQEAALEKHISKPGALKLAELRSPLLEKERTEKKLPDELFNVEPVFDRILVYRFSEHQGDTFSPDGKIVQTERASAARKEQVPRGILVAAGLTALDTLRSNGIDIGHTILMVRNIAWRIVCVEIDGIPFSLLVLRDGDIVGSETLQKQLASKEVSVKQTKTKDGGVQHIFVDQDGKNWIPRPAWIPDDM